MCLEKLRDSPHRALSLSLSPPGTVFSPFLTKELSTARNIKDRQNRQVVVRTLTRIRERLNVVKNINGLIVFAGLDEFEQEILEVIDLREGAKLNMFYYNCSKNFNAEFAVQYVTDYEGSIVFANGCECMIYSFEGGTFRRVKHITANLQKRQRKGGMSSLRIARLAEESRHNYVVRAVDYLNSLETNNNWLFGSAEITGMILSNKTLLVKLNNGGFLDFNSHTINDQKLFLDYLESSKRGEADVANGKIFERILFYLDTNPDMLDFDKNQKDSMSAYLLKNAEEVDMKSPNYLPLPLSSVYYARLQMFEYIGLKYFARTEYEHNNEDDVYPSSSFSASVGVENPVEAIFSP